MVFLGRLIVKRLSNRQSFIFFLTLIRIIKVKITNRACGIKSKKSKKNEIKKWRISGVLVELIKNMKIIFEKSLDFLTICAHTMRAFKLGINQKTLNP